MVEKVYNVENLARWPKGTLPPGLYPGLPRDPQFRCKVPGCRLWRMRDRDGLCYRHAGRPLSTVRQQVARRRNRAWAREAAQIRSALARALRALPDALRDAPAWARALALPEGERGPRDACCLALAQAWDNPEAWARALALLQAAERGEVTGSGGDHVSAIGGSGVV